MDSPADARLLRLLPAPPTEVPARGLYLSEPIRECAESRPWVYSNFIASLDGHISEPDPTSGRRRVPPAIANPLDWYLYTELLTQADVVLTTARHLRAIAAGRHVTLLRLPESNPDLAEWRAGHGLPPQPVIAIFSRGLDLPLAALRDLGLESLVVITTETADPARRRELERQGVQVMLAGEGDDVDAALAIGMLADQGHRAIYSIAGPHVMQALLEAGVLDALYLTVATVLLGGREYDGLTAGEPLRPPAGFRVEKVFLDRSAPERGEQLFLALVRRT